MSQQTAKVTPALGRALDFMRQNLKTMWRDGERLPTMTELSSMAGVSRGTMVRAIAQLSDEGRVTAMRRRGIVAGTIPPGTVSRRPDGGRHKWEQLKRRIEFDLYDGTFHKVQMLPAAKQLQAHYGVDFRTLKKALSALVGERVLRMRKRAYHIVRPEESLADNAVAYVSPRELYHTPYRSYPEPGDLIRLLESECGRRRLQFRPVATHDNDTFARTVQDYRTLGGLFYHSAQYGDEIIELFSSRRKPMSMFDNFNHTRERFSDTFLQKNRMRIFQFDEIFAGNEVGRFLLRMGHRQVAFISPFHGDWVYPIRYESVREVVEGANDGNRVHLVSVNNLRTTLHVRADDMLRRRRASGQGQRAIDMYGELKEMGLNEGSDEILLSWVSDEGWTVSPQHVFNAVLYRELVPLFEQALAIREATALVCANDAIAILALRYLRAQSVSVPERVSVIGFDNTGDASYNDLTSYDFDVSAIALKMIDHILRPDSTLLAPSQRIVNSEGMVIPRGSTKRLPQD